MASDFKPSPTICYNAGMAENPTDTPEPEKQTVRVCPKCGGSMTEGFMQDLSHAATFQARWVEGEPVKSFWTGVKTVGKRQFNATTYRCEGCGFLESFADKPAQ
jgi:predicted RNA-binding Zn-ribbon protein involved in translation (DUF1610 family)